MKELFKKIGFTDNDYETLEQMNSDFVRYHVKELTVEQYIGFYKLLVFEDIYKELCDLNTIIKFADFGYSADYSKEIESVRKSIDEVESSIGVMSEILEYGLAALTECLEKISDARDGKA